VGSLNTLRWSARRHLCKVREMGLLRLFNRSDLSSTSNFIFRVGCKLFNDFCRLGLLDTLCLGRLLNDTFYRLAPSSWTLNNRFNLFFLIFIVIRVEIDELLWVKVVCLVVGLIEFRIVHLVYILKSQSL